MTQLEPYTSVNNEGEPTATRRDLVRVLFKRRWTILLCFAIVAAITSGGVARLPPTYEARAKVLVQTEQQATPSFFSGVAAYTDRRDWDPVNRRLENEMALVEAAPIAGRVVRELGLGWDAIYHPPLTHVAQPAVDLAGRLLESTMGIPHLPPSEAETVAALQASLGVSPAESKTAETTSNIFVVTLKAPEPRTAQDALSRILELYLDFDRELSEEAGQKARTLVTDELKAARRRVTTAEAEMREFLAATKFDLANTTRGQTAAGGHSDQTVTSARDSQAVTQLKARLIDLQSHLTEARQIYKPESENVQRLERTIAEEQGRLAQEIARGADNFARHNQLDRALRTAEARSDELDRRLAEINLFMQINKQPMANRVVIEPPILPEKSDWKRRMATAVLGSVMGLILGVLIAGVAEYADSTLGSKEAVRRHVGVDVVATIPRATRKELKTVFVDEPVSAAGAFAARRMSLSAGALACQLTSGMNGNGNPSLSKRGHSLLVTSARDGEGKTFTATLLTRALVRLGCGDVLLVDDSMIRTEPAVSRLRSFLDREKQRFDWIVFDGGTIGEPDVSALAREVDGIVLVVEADTTRRHVVQHALEVLGVHDPRKVKVVLNRKRHHIPTFLYDKV